MFHVDNPQVRQLLLSGSFGLERETLRVTTDGHLAQTPSPFPDEEHIVRDFSENQVEINTPIAHSPAEAVQEILRYDGIVQRTLAQLPERELLWPFSNPPYIRNEADVPIAQYVGEQAGKTEYREHLSDVYGRYKMAFSGIHFNYSFSDELLHADFALAEEDDFDTYKARVYLELAQRCVAYGWLMTAITAASPVMDLSFVEKRGAGQDLFLGLSTVRCSELGYWNFFAPVLDYSDIAAYADSIQRYIDLGLIQYPSELYYPIRLKPAGAYGAEGLRAGKVSHIELRMFDLNPLVPGLVDERDVFFGQLFLTWLASTPTQPLSVRDQVQAVQNFKNAAHYDLRTVKIVIPDGRAKTVVDAALDVIGFMEEFYAGFPSEVGENLVFQKEKFLHPETRYAHQVRERYGEGFVAKGIELARELQEGQLR